MLIRLDQTIANRPAVDVRDALKRLHSRTFSLRSAAGWLRCSEPDAAAFVDDMVAEGFIEHCKNVRENLLDSDECRPAVSLYELAIAGHALARAHIGDPISRARAQTLLDGVLQRVHEVNANDDWLYWVDELVLFGSFSRPGDGPVGDVDLAFEVERREMTDAEWERRVDEIIEREDKRLGSTTERIFFPGRRVRKFLKGGSPRVDLVELRRGSGLPPGSVPIVLFRREH